MRNTGDVSPHCFRRRGYYVLSPPNIFLFRFCIWRGFKNKSDICHVLCEELFMFDVVHIAKLMLIQGLAWSLILIFFINFCLDKIIFSLLHVSKDRERLLKLLLSDILPCAIYCTKAHCFETSEVGYSRIVLPCRTFIPLQGFWLHWWISKFSKYLCGAWNKWDFNSCLETNEILAGVLKQMRL